ncbi:ArsR/SmtB family transcription factor [Natronococcus wangiae]|uniref:ArsR/SmtB family transcription factor n=1 Tax=Natronococcus wangiae TaxID=3068275 RepID=UPI00273F9105|nr:transcriptional regulator [Natronococcus sp. AD5]
MVERPPNDPDLVAIFRAPTRRAPTVQFTEGPESVGKPTDSHDRPPATVSTHLQVLEDAGILDVAKDGRVHRRHVNTAPLRWPSAG